MPPRLRRVWYVTFPTGVGGVPLLPSWRYGAGSRTLAAVDLLLRPEPQTVTVGEQVGIGLFAVSDDGTDQSFSAMDVIFTWDPTALEFVEAINPGTHSWFLYGLLPDGELDGLNDSFLDGNALFQAASFSEATATADGLRVI